MGRRAGCRLSTEPRRLHVIFANLGRVANAAALLFLVYVFAAMFVEAAGAKLAVEKLTIRTATGVHVIEAEIAERPEDTQRGLMFRTSVPANTGMLFLFGDPREISMWMQNTYVSLDMIFIRADGVVHRIQRRTEPMSERTISSEGPVSSVLEVAAGEADRLGIKPGDRVEHRAFRPQARKK